MTKFSFVIGFALLASVAAKADNCISKTFTFKPSSETAETCKAMGFSGPASFYGCSDGKGTLTTKTLKLDVTTGTQGWTSRSTDTDSETGTSQVSVFTMSFQAGKYEAREFTQTRRGQPLGAARNCVGTMTMK